MVYQLEGELGRDGCPLRTTGRERVLADRDELFQTAHDNDTTLEIRLLNSDPSEV